MKNNRREFIKQTGLAGLALSTTGTKPVMDTLISTNSSSTGIRLLSPVDGDMLNSYDGVSTDGYLLTNVKITAPVGHEIQVNGVAASFTDGVYTAEIRLKNYQNVIQVKDVTSKESKKITVFWLKKIVNKYRLSLDDNIWFLQDISKNANRYRSIFENPYLSLFKQVHDTYGTKIHFNIYYQTEGFDLSQMTDKFKNEWKENAGWIKLNFHALQNDPDRPYINAGYDEVKRDCDMVMDQIRRFAGEEMLGPVTTLHWGEATVEGCRALRDSGYKGLSGYFNVDDTEPVSYYLNMDQRRNLNNRFIWRDNKEGIIFTRIALVINTVRLEEIVPYLEGLRSDSHKPAYIDLMIHEQYFYPFYVAYQPDYGIKVMTAVKWAIDNGFQPAFLSECIFD
jgi:hypothetical protein